MMTTSERIAGILRAFPERSVSVVREPSGFRAGFGSDSKGSYTPCRPTPEDAVEYFHNVLVQGAEKGLANASKHLSHLTSVVATEDALVQGPSTGKDSGT